MKKFFLLADDDNDDAEMFNEALSSIDPQMEFHHVEDGYELFQFLKDTPRMKPDIIFLDLNMPEMSGWQCLAKLKNDPDFKDVPVIMYSTSSSARDKEIAIDLGAVGFLTKPDDYKVLVKILSGFANSSTADLKKIGRRD